MGKSEGKLHVSAKVSIQSSASVRTTCKGVCVIGSEKRPSLLLSMVLGAFDRGLDRKDLPALALSL